VVPWYVPTSGKAAPVADADGEAALHYLHQSVGLLTQMRVVVVMGGFAERWWLHHLRRPESPVLPLV
jgi:uracil-DNA glycosylase